MINWGASVTLVLKIHFRLQEGCLIALGNCDALGSDKIEKALKLESKDKENWTARVHVPVGEQLVVYKYGILTGKNPRFEAVQSKRSISLQGLKRGDVVTVRDTWRSPKSNVFVSTAFREAIFAGKPDGQVLTRTDSELGDKTAATIWSEPSGGNVMVRFTVNVPRLTYGHTVNMTGAHESLGNWDMEKKIPMVNLGRNLYSVIMELPREDLGFEFKYCIFDENDKFVFRERETPRAIDPVDDEVKYLSIDESFKYETTWKGAGVAVPVFSLRTEESIGIGEFLDIRTLVDWANQVNFSLVQVLPVNDTGDNPSPYSATSVFALHPVYINLQEVAKLTFGGLDKTPGDIMREIDQAKADFNRLEEIDYTRVLERKNKILEMIFKEGGENVMADAECKAWLERSTWLPAYACWKAIMNQTGEWVFSKWEYTVKDVPFLTSPESDIYERVRFHFFVQYNLHLQLLEASRYAKRHGVALKGDLPIGVARYCADTWQDINMFKMDWSAGAPAHGPPPAQNWDFPLYNWDVMKKDGYQWWKRRLTAMEEYFQAFRIDHVLGFFRIWAIPAHNYSGLLGRYDPCPKPITKKELDGLGIKKLDRYMNPYITKKLIEEKFGSLAKFATEKFLDVEKDTYKLKEQVSTEAKITEEVYHWKYNDDLKEEERHKIKDGLFYFIDNRVLIQDDADSSKFYLTCHLFHTTAYNEIKDEDVKRKFERLWHNFFWERQSWREDGYEKLSALQDAANMMVCAEDLGAVPAEAYEVLEGLGILGLRIQRWPISGQWGEPQKYNYLSVCAPSCHDCSTVRQWWTEDRGARQHFYTSNFGGEGPWECYDWVSQKIVEQHLQSTSMWAVIPIQDLMDMWDELRSQDPLKDMINRPGTCDGNWVYRMRLPLSQLCEKTAFSKFLGDMVKRCGRTNAY